MLKRIHVQFAAHHIVWLERRANARGSTVAQVLRDVVQAAIDAENAPQPAPSTSRRGRPPHVAAPTPSTSPASVEPAPDEDGPLEPTPEEWDEINSGRLSLPAVPNSTVEIESDLQTAIDDVIARDLLSGPK